MHLTRVVTNELNERVKREVIPKGFRISAAAEAASSLPIKITFA